MELIELTLRLRVENGALELTILDGKEIVGRKHIGIEPDLDVRADALP